MRSVSITVRGRVQGVFFRSSAVESARALGIAGTAANGSDGTVRIEAEGDDAAVARFIEWCGEGPRSARVSAVDVEERSPRGFVSFIIG